MCRVKSGQPEGARNAAIPRGHSSSLDTASPYSIASEIRYGNTAFPPCIYPSFQLKRGQSRCQTKTARSLTGHIPCVKKIEIRRSGCHEPEYDSGKSSQQQDTNSKQHFYTNPKNLDRLDHQGVLLGKRFYQFGGRPLLIAQLDK